MRTLSHTAPWCVLLGLPLLAPACGGDDDDLPGFDADGDGFTHVEGDCDDTNPRANPATVELCDGFDNDCDDETDVTPVSSPAALPPPPCDGGA